MAISNASSGLRPGVCTSTTRPTSPYEGQMIYETDTDMVAIWNGSAWRYIASTTPTNGTVLQVVNATYSTQVAESAGTWTTTGLTASITPKSSNSKILVIATQSMYNYAAGGSFTAMNVRLVRGTSTVLHTTLDAGFTRTGASAGTDIVFQYAINYLDSPATTSSVSYKTEFQKSYGYQCYAQINSNPSNIVLMEIAG